LIEAPLEAVWNLVGDPSRYPEWAGNVLEVTGLATLEEGSTFRQKGRTPMGSQTTTFVIDDLDDMREIKLRCLQSGYYAHWMLTEARGETFADVEIGMDPATLGYRAFDTVMGRRWYRRLVDNSLTGLAEVACGETVGR
jgi:uncharacterized protein YndB with AHSA1/START domain